MHAYITRALHGRTPPLPPQPFHLLLEPFNVAPLKVLPPLLVGITTANRRNRRNRRLLAPGVQRGARAQPGIFLLLAQNLTLQGEHAFVQPCQLLALRLACLLCTRRRCRQMLLLLPCVVELPM